MWHVTSQNQKAPVKILLFVHVCTIFLVFALRIVIWFWNTNFSILQNKNWWLQGKTQISKSKVSKSRTKPMMSKTKPKFGRQIIVSDGDRQDRLPVDFQWAAYPSLTSLCRELFFFCIPLGVWAHFFTMVFTPNSSLIGQTLGMAGLPNAIRS